MVHTDVRYDCELCNKTYKAAQSLKAHVEIAHEGKPKPSLDALFVTRVLKVVQV